MKALGLYPNLKEALQKAANYWGETIAYYYGERKGTYTLETQDGEEIGKIEKLSRSFLVAVKFKDPTFQMIQKGDRVSITTVEGNRKTGTAFVANPKAEMWVCKNGNDSFLASEVNTVRVVRDGKVIYGFVND